ncbi:MAG: hypothetical protein KC613_22520 [Myxococcales bacterium]|nr:hypothetical protein [Myxococcales bacterium]
MRGQVMRGQVMGRLGLLLGLWALAGCHTSHEQQEPKTSVGHGVHVRNGVNCVECHGDMTKDTSGKPHLPENKVCVACHEDSHKGEADKGDCLSCHQEEEAEEALTYLKQSLTFDHAKHLKITDGQCVKCHKNAAEKESARTGAVPTMADCAECHQPWLDGLKCEACHANLTNYPLRPVTHQAHVGDFLRRHGGEARVAVERCGQCHSQNFCADCHDKRAPMAAYQMLPDRLDRHFIHEPAFVERHAHEASIEGPLCVSCHTESECQACHTAAGRGPGGLNPHPAGWASLSPSGGNRHGPEARRDILSCASCHSGPGADLCVSCHAPGRPGGSPHPPGYQTGGRIRQDQPCVRCHVGGR